MFLRKININVFVFIIFSTTYECYCRDFLFGINAISTFFSTKQIFNEETNYKISNNKAEWKGNLKNIILSLPLSYKLFYKHKFIVANVFSHDFRYHFSFFISKQREYIVDVNVANMLTNKMKEVIDEDQSEGVSSLGISSFWLNIKLLHNLLSNNSDRYNFFCYGFGINISKISSIYIDDTNAYLKKLKSKENVEGLVNKTFSYYVWLNWSVHVNNIIYGIISISTVITFDFFIFKVKPWSCKKDEIKRKINNDVEWDKVFGYNQEMDGNFLFINTKPRLSIFLNLNLPSSKNKNVNNDMYTM